MLALDLPDAASGVSLLRWLQGEAVSMDPMPAWPVSSTLSLVAVSLAAGAEAPRARLVLDQAAMRALVETPQCFHIWFQVPRAALAAMFPTLLDWQRPPSSA